MLTTNHLITFLQLREGFRKHAYDDAQPNVRLTVETKIKGTITIGYGTTRYPDDRPVKWDDTVSKSEAVDYLVHYIRETIEPALENLIHVPLAGCQYDAIGSCIYQYGESEVASWNLIRLINSGADWEDIAREWINGTVMWRGEPLFWGRRVMELFMFLGLDFRAGENVPVLSDVTSAARMMGFDGTMPKPDPIIDEDLFYDDPDLSIPHPGAQPMEPITDPTEDTPLTTDDLNAMQLESLRTGRPISITPVTPKVPLESYEYLSDEQKKKPEVKDVTKAQRGRAVGKKAVSKGTGAAGVGGAVALATGTAEPVLKVVDKYPKETLAWVAVGLIITAIVYHFWSEWQLQKGRDDADTLLG